MSFIAFVVFFLGAVLVGSRAILRWRWRKYCNELPHDKEYDCFLILVGLIMMVGGYGYALYLLVRAS